MAITTTTRMGLIRWSSDNDPFNRTQADANSEAMEQRAAIFAMGTIEARPNPDLSNQRGFYLATNQNAPHGILYYSDGSIWSALNAFGTPVPIAFGDTASAGVASTYARSDHRHAAPSWGTVGQMQAVGTAASAGSINNPARIDHVHVLAAGSVTAGKIAAGGVSASNQIANGIIVAEHFAPGAISTAAIAADQRIPVGGIMMYGGLTAPAGFLMCDGTLYPTASYPGLFNAIGYRYGGSGANFAVPDYRNRAPRGASDTTASAALGVRMGADTVALNDPQYMPSHAHFLYTGYTESRGEHRHQVYMNTQPENQGHEHNIASGWTSESGDHVHGPAQGTQYLNFGPGTNFAGFASVAGALQYNLYGSGTTQWGGNHTHTVSGYTDGPNRPHIHLVSGDTGPGGTHSHPLGGYAEFNGSGAPFSILNPILTSNFIIKV